MILTLPVAIPAAVAVGAAIIVVGGAAYVTYSTIDNVLGQAEAIVYRGSHERASGSPQNENLYQARGGGSGQKLTREVMRKEGTTAQEAISKYKKGSVNSAFPSQYKGSTLDEIEAAAKKGDRDAFRALKLLFDRRFDK